MKDLDVLVECVENVFKVDDLLLKSRRRNLVDARRVFCFIAVKKLKYSLSRIANYLSNNHATVLHASKTFEIIIAQDREFSEKHHEVLQLFSNKYKKPIINIPDILSQISFHKERIKDLRKDLKNI